MYMTWFWNSLHFFINSLLYIKHKLPYTGYTLILNSITKLAYPGRFSRPVPPHKTPLLLGSVPQHRIISHQYQTPTNISITNISLAMHTVKVLSAHFCFQFPFCDKSLYMYQYVRTFIIFV